MPPVLIDISEFIASPIRTGIQRVVRALLDHWPAEVPFETVEYDPQRRALVAVDPGALRFARDFQTNPHLSVEALTGLMAERPRGDPVDVRGRRVLVPELFYERGRAQFYVEAAARDMRAAFIVYDFLPWKYPDHFGRDSTAALNPYLRAVMAAERRCFISEPVRRDYFTLVRRTTPAGDPAIPLGADGLGLPRGAAAAGEIGDTYLCFGAFDGRKGQHLVLDGFLKSAGAARHRLLFAGRILPARRDYATAILACTDPRVSVIEDPADADLARLVARARAVVFVSELEGYGLPATEALYAGVPVMVHRGLPAIDGLPDDGQLRLADLAPATIADGFDTLAPDAEIARLRDGARRLTLTTWVDYAPAVAGWVTESPPARRRTAKTAAR